MSEINVTPLVDVMLVLVVILIITAPLLASSLRLNLPRAQAVQPTDAPRFVTLAFTSTGQLYLDEKHVTPAQLGERLGQIARANPDTEIQLRADESIPYGKVVEIMGVAQKAGLSRIGFVAEPPLK
jgi:biopolymer transport protein TolR